MLGNLHERFNSGSNETEFPSPKIVFIDEHSPLHPYVQHGEIERFPDLRRSPSNSSYSREGYVFNEDRQRFVGRTITDLFAFKSRGVTVLEVGHGLNYYIAEGIQQRSGLQVLLLDTPGNAKILELNILPPKRLGYIWPGLLSYEGDVKDIDDDESDLKNHRFVSILFNGSWDSSENNATVHVIMNTQYYKQSGDDDFGSKEYIRFVHHYKDNLFKLLKSHLTQDGILYIASSRYAFRGGGYPFGKLSEEKNEFIDIIKRVAKLGSKKITIIGISRDGLKAMLSRTYLNPPWEEVLHMNQEVRKFCNHIIEELTQDDELLPSPIGRIDAIGVQF